MYVNEIISETNENLYNMIHVDITIRLHNNVIDF